MYPLKALMTAALAALAVPLTAQLRTGEILDLAWEMEAPEALASARAATVFNLRLVTVSDGPELHRFLIRRSQMESTPSAMSSAGLPRGMVPTALAGSETTSHLFLAGLIGERPVVYRAEASSAAEVGSWEALPAFPLDSDTRIHHLATRDEFLHAFTQRAGEGTFTLGGYVAHGGVPLANFEWKSIPVPPTPRVGHATILAGDHVILVGGRVVSPETAEPGRPAALCKLAPISGTEYGEWFQSPIPVSPRFTDIVGVSATGGLMVTPRIPLTGDNVPTSMTLLVAGVGAGLATTEFHPVALDLPQQHVLGMLADLPHSWLLVVGKDEPDSAPRLTAWNLPVWFQAQAQTEADYSRRILEVAARVPPEIPLRATLNEARNSDRLAIVVIPGEDEDIALETRAAMSHPTFRYMVRGMVTTYLTGSEAAEAMGRYGITRTPAVIVLDGNGNVAGEHSGSIPRHDELFRLTSPSRGPVGETE